MKVIEIDKIFEAVQELTRKMYDKEYSEEAKEDLKLLLNGLDPESDVKILDHVHGKRVGICIEKANLDGGWTKYAFGLNKPEDLDSLFIDTADLMQITERPHHNMSGYIIFDDDKGHYSLNRNNTEEDMHKIKASDNFTSIEQAVLFNKIMREGVRSLEQQQTYELASSEKEFVAKELATKEKRKEIRRTEGDKAAKIIHREAEFARRSEINAQKNQQWEESVRESESKQQKEIKELETMKKYIKAREIAEAHKDEEGMNPEIKQLLADYYGEQEKNEKSR